VNGVHDMGGMHGFGSVELEAREPVFHAPWEGRLFALRRAAGAWRKWNIDAMRYSIERLAPSDYLTASYYARQYLGFAELLVERGLVTRAEIDSGRPEAGGSKLTPPLTGAKIPQMVADGSPTSRDVGKPSRISVGQLVRTRKINPVNHTRLPRYARGRSGTIVRDHGVFVFPDSNSQFQGEQPQHLYSVRFSARELWGDQASARDAVYLDLWDEYLEAA